MANIFDIQRLAGTIAAAKDKAVSVAGEYGLNEIVGGHVLPPIPGGFGDVKDTVPKADHYEPEELNTRSIINNASYGELAKIEQEQLDTVKYTLFNTPMCFPLSVKRSSQKNSEWWLLPVEPIISIHSSNDVIRRKVAKVSAGLNRRRGTIKERWAQDDYSISIEGILTRWDEWKYPTQDVQRLRQIMEAREPIDVQCALFEIVGVGRIVIDSFKLPFTKGEENQAYSIEAFSDDDWDLLIKKSSS